MCVRLQVDSKPKMSSDRADVHLVRYRVMHQVVSWVESAVIHMDTRSALKKKFYRTSATLWDMNEDQRHDRVFDIGNREFICGTERMQRGGLSRSLRETQRVVLSSSTRLMQKKFWL